MQPAYEIETPRLRLRVWHPGDAPALAAAIEEDPEHLRRWLPWAKAEPLDLAAREGVLRRFRGSFDLDQEYVYAIVERSSERLRGGIGLHPRGAGLHEIGYWLAASAVGHGFASEAVAALVWAGFELHALRRIEVRCAADNTRSNAIPRRLGFVHDGSLRGCAPDLGDGRLRDLEVWGILRADYLRSQLCTQRLVARDVLGRVLVSTAA